MPPPCQVMDVPVEKNIHALVEIKRISSLRLCFSILKCPRSTSSSRCISSATQSCIYRFMCLCFRLYFGNMHATCFHFLRHLISRRWRWRQDEPPAECKSLYFSHPYLFPFSDCVTSSKDNLKMSLSINWLNTTHGAQFQIQSLHI